MNNYTLESFITFCDDMMIVEEGLTFNRQNITNIKMFGKNATVVLVDDDGVINNPLIKKQVDSVLKLVSSSNELYDYLVKYHKKFFDYINDDPYFEGRTVYNGEDLINAILENTKYTIVIDNYRHCIYFCGEYWVDPEHGFSISFPNGKFVKATIGTKYYDSNYKPIATGLGQFGDAL